MVDLEHSVEQLVAAVEGVIGAEVERTAENGELTLNCTSSCQIAARLIFATLTGSKSGIKLLQALVQILCRARAQIEDDVLLPAKRPQNTKPKFICLLGLVRYSVS